MTPSAADASTTSKRLERLATGVLVLSLGCATAVLGLAAMQATRPLGLDQLLAWFVAPGAACLGLIACLRASGPARVTAALVLFALGFATLSAELVAAVVMHGRSGDESPPGRIISDMVDSLRLAGVRTYPTVPGNVLVDRDISLTVEAGIVHPITPLPGATTGVLCGEVGGVTYVSDRFGFNNPDSVWTRDRVELVLSGDSYVHGVCVPPPAQLGALMSRDFEVLNLGARGAGPLQSLAILREYGSLVRPRTVVWVYYEGNDPYDLRRETARDWLTSYLDERHTQNLSTVHEQIDGAYARWIDSLLVNRSADQPVTTDSGIDFPGILKLRSLRSLTGFNVPFPSEASDMGHLPQIFDDAAREVSDWGGRFYLAYLPSYERYAPHFRDGMPGKPQVLEAAQRAGITIIDLDVAFRAAGTPTAFWAHPRGHLNERGYRLVAREIADAIRSTPDRPPTP